MYCVLPLSLFISFALLWGPIIPTTRSLIYNYNPEMCFSYFWSSHIPWHLIETCSREWRKSSQCISVEISRYYMAILQELQLKTNVLWKKSVQTILDNAVKRPFSFVYKKKMIEGVEFVKREAKTNLGDVQWEKVFSLYSSKRTEEANESFKCWKLLGGYFRVLCAIFHKKNSSI